MYGKIKDMRRLEVKINRGGELVYSGKVEEAPEDIKNLSYISIKLDGGIAILEIE